MITNETKVMLGVLAATVVIIVGGVLLTGRGQNGAGVTEPVSEPDRLVREDDYFSGPEQAAVTVVTFEDFQCPACGAVHPVLEQIKSDNPEVKFVFRHFPLRSIHPLAQKAAEAAVEAQVQGKFDEFHDALFENQDKLREEDLLAHAESVGMDVEAVREVLDSDKHEAAVQQDFSDGTAIGVPGTPAIYINGVAYQGGYSVAALQAAIDAAAG